jgi:hypothetical protein
LDVVPLWDILVNSTVGFWKEYENILEAFIAAYISFYFPDNAHFLMPRK